MTSTSGICATGLKKWMPMSRPGSASGSAMFSIMMEDVLVAMIAPGLSLPSIDLNRFCLTSSRSTIASMTTSARGMWSPLGSAISRAAAAARAALVLNLRPNSFFCAAMPLAICSAFMSCSDTSMPEATHQPAMSAPMTPAPITCTRSGLKSRFFGACAFSISDSLNTRRRLRDVSPTISGAKARVSATFMPSRLPACVSNRSISRNGAG